MRKLFFVDCDKMTVVDRHTALNDCVVNGSAHADSAEHAFGVKARADELEPARVDHEEVAALADLERAVAGDEIEHSMLAYTVDNMQIMTQLRRQWGVTYPEEEGLA